MERNIYYIIEADEPKLNEIYKVIVGTNLSQRTSTNKTEIVVKLHKGDKKEYDCLKGAKVKKVSYKKILPIMRSLKWQPLIV